MQIVIAFVVRNKNQVYIVTKCIGYIPEATGGHYGANGMA